MNLDLEFWGQAVMPGEKVDSTPQILMNQCDTYSGVHRRGALIRIRFPVPGLLTISI